MKRKENRQIDIQANDKDNKETNIQSTKVQMVCKQTGQQTNKETDKPTNTQTEKETSRHTDKRMKQTGHADRHITNRKKVQLKRGKADKQTDRH